MSGCNHDKCERDGCRTCCYCRVTLLEDVPTEGANSVTANRESIPHASSEREMDEETIHQYAYDSVMELCAAVEWDELNQDHIASRIIDGINWALDQTKAQSLIAESVSPEETKTIDYLASQLHANNDEFRKYKERIAELETSRESLIERLEELEAKQEFPDYYSANKRLAEDVRKLEQANAELEATVRVRVENIRELEGQKEAALRVYGEMQKRIEELEVRIAEEERIASITIDHRDSHEEYLNQIADALGDNTEWTSHNHRGDRALELIDALHEKVTSLEQANAELKASLKDADSFGHQANKACIEYQKSNAKLRAALERISAWQTDHAIKSIAVEALKAD